MRRRAAFDRRPHAPGFCTLNGDPYDPVAFRGRFIALCQAAGVRGNDGRCPRLHDIRHALPSAALLRWYEKGGDVQVELPKLAMYMGHVSIASTAYYLRLMPVVLRSRASASPARYRSLEGGAP